MQSDLSPAHLTRGYWVTSESKSIKNVASSACICDVEKTPKKAWKSAYNNLK